MPRHAKATKLRRDRGMIAGLTTVPKEWISALSLGRGVVDASIILALYQQHLDALLEVTAKEVAWKAALAIERRLERALKPAHLSVQRILEAQFGNNPYALARFGLKLRKKKAASSATKAAAVKKRNETRASRGTTGRRSRKPAKR